MRINGRHNSRETTPDKAMSSPTPVIVSLGSRLTDRDDRVFKNLDRPVRSPMLYRSTVISPNPERILYSTIEHPSVILSGARLGANLQLGSLLQDKPMDFSSSSGRDFDRQHFGQNTERSTGYAIGLAIAV